VGREYVERAVPLKNVAEDPRTAYRADPEGLLKLLRELDRKGLRVMAFYHSHPRGLAFYSGRDVLEARWPVPYVIFGLKEGRARAFLLPEGKEVPLEVIAP